MGSTRRSSTDEYKRDAVSLIVDGGLSVSEVCQKLSGAKRCADPVPTTTPELTTLADQQFQISKITSTR